MLTYNPFADLSASISPGVMQGYVVLMVILVIVGTVLDMMHKQSAKYFFENARKAQGERGRQLSVRKGTYKQKRIIQNPTIMWANVTCLGAKSKAPSSCRRYTTIKT